MDQMGQLAGNWLHCKISLFPGYVSFRRLQFHHQNRLIISLINKGANTWIITQPPYSHNFCRSKTAINNRELLYLKSCKGGGTWVVNLLAKLARALVLLEPRGCIAVSKTAWREWSHLWKDCFPSFHFIRMPG